METAARELGIILFRVRARAMGIKPGSLQPRVDWKHHGAQFKLNVLAVPDARVSPTAVSSERLNRARFPFWM